jgi:hypothetical protein
MNARTLVITAGAVAAFAAPAVASAKSAPGKVPTKHAAKKHVAKPSLERQGQSRQIYIYIPAPATPVATPNEQQLEQDYNDDLIAHGLDPVQFPDPTPTPAPSSGDTSSFDTSSTSTVNATFEAAVAPSTADALDPTAIDLTDDC